MSVIGSMVSLVDGTVDGMTSSSLEAYPTLTVGMGSPMARLGSVMSPASTSGPALYWDRSNLDLYVATTVGEWAKYAAE